HPRVPRPAHRLLLALLFRLLSSLLRRLLFLLVRGRRVGLALLSLGLLAVLGAPPVRAGVRLDDSHVGRAPERDPEEVEADPQEENQAGGRGQPPLPGHARPSRRWGCQVVVDRSRAVELDRREPPESAVDSP